MSIQNKGYMFVTQNLGYFQQVYPNLVAATRSSYYSRLGGF